MKTINLFGFHNHLGKNSRPSAFKDIYKKNVEDDDKLPFNKLKDGEHYKKQRELNYTK